jgi:hypothetical protein
MLPCLSRRGTRFGSVGFALICTRADSVRELIDGYGEPLDTSVNVEVWRRGEGFKVEDLASVER